MRGAENKYLGFTLAGEDFLVPILDVVEIVGLLPVTPVPGAGEPLRGVVSLRDRVVPVVELFPAPDVPDPTCMVVLQAGDTEVGVFVDRVSEVIDVDSDGIAPAASLGGDLCGDHLAGIAHGPAGVRFVLDVASAIGAGELVPAAPPTGSQP